MSDEAVDAIYKYFGQGDTKLCYYGNETVAKEIVRFVSKGTILSNEEPDLVALYDGACLAIEHFEYDCYKNTSKGSQNRREQARIEYSFKPQMDNQYKHDVIYGKSSYTQYLSNVTKMFLSHYERIAAYKNNLFARQVVNSKDKIKIAFMIEDVSPLGLMVESDDGAMPVLLSNSKEFLALMRQSPDVDYVIACSECGSSRYVWLISSESVDDYEQNSVDYSCMKFIDFTPQVSSFFVSIPNE